MTGKLIVIDGTDSSGKNTQAQILLEHLREKKIASEKADFPQYYTGYYGKMVARYLNGEFGTVKTVSPYFSSLLYALDRLEAKKKLDNWLSKDIFVVSNRYVSSNEAYGAARFDSEPEKEEFLSWLADLEYNQNKMPKPDVIIFLYVPLEITKEWIKTKEKREYLEGKKKDLHEKNTEYLKKVEEEYLALAKKNKWIKIDCVEKGNILSKEQIAEKIWSYILPNL
ncbi:MAG: thymidylate kinase [archaeon]